MSCFIFSPQITESSMYIVGFFYDYMFPAMIPLLISIYVLIDTGVLYYLAYLLQYVTMPLFRINGYGALCIIISILTGFPFSTIMLCKFYKEDKITKKELYVILCSFTLPSFSYLFTTIRNNISGCDFVDLITHLYGVSIISLFTLSRLLLKSGKTTPFSDFKQVVNKQSTLFNFPSSLSQNITLVTNSLAIILGTMVYFNIISIFISNIFDTNYILSGLIEFSFPSIKVAQNNDIFALKTILSFGSLSCFFQCSSILDEHKINSLPLLVFKTFSTLLLFIFWFYK